MQRLTSLFSLAKPRAWLPISSTVRSSASKPHELIPTYDICFHSIDEMLLLDYQNVLIESLLKDRLSG